MCYVRDRLQLQSTQQLLLQLNSHLGEEDRADFVLVEYIMTDI